MNRGIHMVDVVQYKQTNEVNSEVEALFSVVIPILHGILFSLKRDIVSQVGGYEKVTLALLARLYREGDGDCGICFEYAVHDAINKGNPDVLDKINTALERYCKIKQGDPSSILFGAEKQGAMQLIDSSTALLTDDSSLLTGRAGKPIKLKKHIQGVVNAFRKPSERERLPNSINGLWKADLFVGKSEADRWVGTTVKINPAHLEAARGLRLAIVPSKAGENDGIKLNEQKNLIICPMPYDRSFVETFYQGWIDVKQFLNADARVPREVMVPRPNDRFICKQLEDRRDYPVVEVLDALEAMKQPTLLETDKTKAAISSNSPDSARINTIVAPKSLYR